jgi:Cu(I)/Ag(I) efflux system membrane fusion protein
VVYVKVRDRESPTFLYREIVLGPAAGAFYVVNEGLEVGEEIAVNGVFKIDAASQLQGLPSMMNPSAEAGMGVSGHQHGNMDMAENADERFTVYGNCSMCKERIEKAAKSLDGVSKAKWDKAKKELTVTFDPDVTNVEAIEKEVAAVGHDTENVRAKDEVYEKLHSCCKYDRPAKK